MSVDYPGAIDMLLPTDYSFSSVAALSIVEHQTGGDMTLEAIHQTFLASMRSTHFGVDRDGRVAQFVPLNRGAGGNCCPDRGASGNLLCDPYWFPFVEQYGNLNLCTISIEHCNNSSNSLAMTPAQNDASHKLNTWLCQKFRLNSGNLKPHSSINPVAKPFCPGPTFDLAGLKSYVQQNVSQTHMEKQFNEVWASVAGSYISGIAKIVKAGFLAHHYSACFPTSSEIATVDWNGNPILYQGLSNGCYVAYAAGRATIYDGCNRTLYSG
jgi:hypothetical protein